jgi:FixJ family two-component response regulator
MLQLYHVHLVDKFPARRALFAREVIACGMHAEIYDSIEELRSVSSIRGVAHLRRGAILVSDDEGIDIHSSIHALREMECYLPVIAFSTERPCSRRIVAAIQGGALDYMSFPEDLPVLGERIADVSARARQLAHRQERRVQARNRIAQLTERERQVLYFTIEGATSKETAAQLGLSPRTVEVHRAAILQKLGVATSAAAIGLGIAAGMQEYGTVVDSGLSRAA